MGCFFPSIFSKNTWGRVKWLSFGIVMGLFLLLSGCRAVKTVVAAPFKAVGWGADKISKVVGGKGEGSSKTCESNKNGALSEKKIDDCPSGKKNNIKINFKPLAAWGIIFVGIALIVRFLIKKYVYKSVKK